MSAGQGSDGVKSKRANALERAACSAACFSRGNAVKRRRIIMGDRRETVDTMASHHGNKLRRWPCAGSHRHYARHGENGRPAAREPAMLAIRM